MHMKQTPFRCTLVAILLAFGTFMAVLPAQGAAPKSLPLKGGENILFVGNSLTASLSTTLNDVFKANDLPTFNGHHVQIWNQTFETHCTISRATHPTLYHEPGKAPIKNIKVKGANSLLGKGQYDKPEYMEAGWVMTLEVIRKGTPEGKPWDYVILQGYDAGKANNKISVGSDGKPVFEGPFMVYGAQLIEESKKVGAVPILYMAWLLNPEAGGGNEDPNSYYNQNFDRLIASYKSLARAYEIPLVPVGHAMRALSKERKPEEARTAWLMSDVIHGNACGGALLHYCLASALSGKPATEIKYERKSTTNRDLRHYVVGEKENKYELLITPKIDMVVRQAAQDFLKEYGF